MPRGSTLSRRQDRLARPTARPTTPNPVKPAVVHTTAAEPEPSSASDRLDTSDVSKAATNSWPAVRESVESADLEEMAHYERERTTGSLSVADLAASIESSAEFRSVAAGLAAGPAEQNLDRLLYDVTSDNRVVLSLTGSALAQYKLDWLVRNSGRLNKIPFSTYLAGRVACCSSHSSDKSLYFRSEDVAELDRLAGDNFHSPREVLSWIERTLAVSVDEETGEPLRLRPLPPEVWERIDDRKWDEESRADYFERVIRRSVGAD